MATMKGVHVLPQSLTQQLRSPENTESQFVPLFAFTALADEACERLKSYS